MPTRSFTVVDADNSPTQVTLTIASSNTTLLPLSGITLTPGTGSSSATVGATASYLLSFSPTSGRSGTSTVTVTANDGNVTTSRTFTVTISPVVGAPDLVAASDTGSSSTDNNTSDNTPTFSVTLGTGVQIGRAHV